MEKKYQIFISSTYKDLIEARSKVRDAILSMMHFPVGMEMFNAADEEQWEIIQETIDGSDYYVLILGQRYFFAFFEKIVVPILTSGGLAAVSSSAFAALYSAFGKYDVVHIHAEGPAFFAWLPKMFGKRVVVTVHGIDWQREKWQSGLGSKFIHQGEKNAAKYADEVIVLSKGVQDYRHNEMLY